MELIAIFIGVTLAAIAGPWVAKWVAKKKRRNVIKWNFEEPFLEPLEPIGEIENERTFRVPPRPDPLTGEVVIIAQDLENEIEQLTQEYKFDSETLKEVAALLSRRYVTNETRRLIIRNLEYQVKLGAAERREVDRR